jgi:hypothetical protein
MDRLGIHTANLGLPGAGGRPREDILKLTQHIAKQRLRIGANVACRTVVSDIEPVVEMTQKAGIPIEVCAFIGSSYIRQYAEDWTLERMLQNTREALTFAQRHNLPVMYVTEDTTRARPETIKALYSTAIELGARRLCVCDTVGHATPQGTRAVVQFVRELADQHDKTLGIDWHGHRDRDLGIANCLAAIEAGRRPCARHGARRRRTRRQRADGPAAGELPPARLDRQRPAHAAAVRRRRRQGARRDDPAQLPRARHDAFETGTGVHAAAVIKAFKKGDVELADAVYSGVPAGMVGPRAEDRGRADGGQIERRLRARATRHRADRGAHPTRPCRRQVEQAAADRREVRRAAQAPEPPRPPDGPSSSSGARADPWSCTGGACNQSWT